MVNLVRRSQKKHFKHEIVETLLPPIGMLFLDIV